MAQVWRRTGAGGSEATFWRMYAALDHSQVQWDFFVENTGLFIDRTQIEQYGGRVFIVPPLTQPRRYQRVLRTIFQREKYDIVHAHLNELSYFPLKAAQAAGVPVRIAHAHAGTHWRDGGKTLIKIWLRPRVRKVATHAWAVSTQAAKQMFGARALAAGQVTILRNALQLAPFAFDATVRAQMRQQLQIGNHQFVVGHVGRMTRQKNHAWLVRVFAQIAQQRADAVLLLVGDGAGLTRVQRQIARYGLTDRVRIVGVQNPVAPYFQAMDVFVLPSYYEGLPAVAVEAQSNGLPCVLADTITAEAVLTADCCRLPLRDVKLWARTVFAMGERREQIAVDPRVFQPFVAARQAAQLVTLYRGMVTQGGAV
ncbi:MAG: glycosyltransferase [Prevotella sp.]|nr:glycosyltransferase [Prevotella sp.]